MPVWQPLLDWWFGRELTAAESVAQRFGLWFDYTPEQDEQARILFGDQVERALQGRLPEWNAEPQGWLAEVLLLDQLPRMIHRGTPVAFSGDVRAQLLVHEGLAAGRDQALAPLQRAFIYLVLEHTETLAAQDESVERFTALRDLMPAEQRKPFDGFVDYALAHRDVVARFGRFPHRNAILGRASTPEEQRYLKEPGSGF